MPPILTTGQLRWALHILLAILSGVAIATSAPPSVGGVKMFNGHSGDIRGPQVLLGSIALGSILVLRSGYVFLPKPWRVYLDRLEFAVMSMLWIAWTSATMAFSAFTITEGVCSIDLSQTYLPTCPLLTFDLIILHLLSTSALALCLVVLSTALLPSYWLAHSNIEGVPSGKDDPESTDAFVMWDLALASPPSSPRLSPQNSLQPSQARTYGTTSPGIPILPESYPQPGSTPTEIPVKRDKFAAGRLWYYVPLLLCSIFACAACIISLLAGSNKYVMIFPITACGVSLGFATAMLVRHVMSKRKGADKSPASRHARAVEIGLAGVLFLILPVTAIMVTLFPPTANRPCTNPAASFDSPEEADLPMIEINVLCMSTTVSVALAWMASWITLVRVLSLIVPMPQLGKSATVAPVSVRGEEGQSLLRSKPVVPEGQNRPQVKWGRMVAGEAFELGDDDDE